ncbi:isopenicillin N synthase-like [Hydra vulgaris]|uniref:Isopenicillin N synthase-like n=1 Tax=Hydra vulgaris TaxID=6087 RepID=A0ABM4CIB4_HYDVU
MAAYICTLAIVFISIIFYKYITIVDIFDFISLYKENTFELASINLTEAEDNYNNVAQRLVKASHDVGFVYLTDVKGYNSEELLIWTKWFFNLDIDKKMKIAKKSFNEINANVYRGYFPVVEGGHSYKEAFEMGGFNSNYATEYPTPSNIRNITTFDGKPIMRNVLEERNTWPVSGNYTEDRQFRLVMEKYRRFFYETSSVIFRLMIHGLGFEKESYDYLFGPRSLSTYRLIHYPSRLANSPETIPDEAWDGDIAIATGEHFDSTIITLLSTFHFNGLQIKPVGYSKWINVPADKDRLVVNVGALLEHLADRKMVATNHRVLDGGNSRYSVAMFYEPSHDADISKTFSGKKNDYVGNFIKYGLWMSNRTKMFAEYRTTDFGVDVD